MTKRKQEEEPRKRRAGQPSKWPRVKKALDDGRIKAWVEAGMWEKTIAENLEVSHQTFSLYKQKYPELAKELESSTKILVGKVEDALFKRAFGYNYEEITEHTETVKNKNGETVTVVKTDVKQCHSKPDVAACIFILKNKTQGAWKNDPDLAAARARELDLKERIAEGSGKVWDDEQAQ